MPNSAIQAATRSPKTCGFPKSKAQPPHEARFPYASCGRWPLPSTRAAPKRWFPSHYCLIVPRLQLFPRSASSSPLSRRLGPRKPALELSMIPSRIWGWLRAPYASLRRSRRTHSFSLSKIPLFFGYPESEMPFSVQTCPCRT